MISMYFKRLSVLTVSLMMLYAIALPLSSPAARAGAVPTINSVSPDQGNQETTIDVTITGTNLDCVAFVFDICFGGNGITVKQIKSVSSDEVVVTIEIAADATLGQRNVRVYYGTGSDYAELTNGFTVVPPAPTVSSVSPDQCQQGDTCDTTITGVNLDSVYQLYFGAGITFGNFTTQNANQILVTVDVSPDAEVGLRDVSVISLGGTGTLTGAFTVTSGSSQTSTADPPEADFSFDVDGSEREEGWSVPFTDMSSGEITSWAWNFGDGETSAEKNPTHFYGVDGTYTVSLTVTGPGGSDTETKTDCIALDRSGGKEAICARSSSSLGAVSAIDLTMGWGIIGLCWGTGYFVVKGMGKRKKK